MGECGAHCSRSTHHPGANLVPLGGGRASASDHMASHRPGVPLGCVWTSASDNVATHCPGANLVPLGCGWIVQLPLCTVLNKNSPINRKFDVARAVVFMLQDALYIYIPLGSVWPCDLMRRSTHCPGVPLGSGWTCCCELRTHTPPRGHTQPTGCVCPCTVCRGQFPHRY